MTGARFLHEPARARWLGRPDRERLAAASRAGEPRDYMLEFVDPLTRRTTPRDLPRPFRLHCGLAFLLTDFFS
jgi:hypothetical protein